MRSVGTDEWIVIAIVALAVFGPQRLPEIVRKAGGLLKMAREVTGSLTEVLNAEIESATAPLKDLKSEHDQAITSVTEALNPEYDSIAAPITDL